MAANLKDLIVECVSLVDRAAVRDPSNPTEPQRLLFWKAESDRSTTMAGAQQAMSDAISSLQPHSADPQVAGLIQKISAIRDADDGGDRLAKAMVDVERLIKSEGDHVPPETLAKAKQAHKDLQLEYLHQQSPSAGEHYEQQLRQVA